jgi:hypothetical protein
VKPALEETDHEGVTGDSRVQSIGERSSEIVSDLGAERFAGAKPNEGSGLEALAKSFETGKERVRRRECSTIEAFAVDERAAPLAVTPELELADGSIRGVLGEEVERIGPVSSTVSGVDAAESTI